MAKVHGVALVFSKLREINKIGDRIIRVLRDKLYAKVLRFSLNNRFLALAIAFSLLILTAGSIGGGIIRTTFFPQIASDQVSVTLKMPEGTGHLSGFWDGKKVNSPAELPQEMLTRLEREYPELLEPRWSEFDSPVPFEL